MRLLLVALLVLAVPVIAQEAPPLTAEQQVMVEAVMALQARWLEDTRALPSYKPYSELKGRADTLLRTKGVRIDWSNGQASKLKD